MDRMQEPAADAEVVARVRAGDADAFRILVDRHSRALYRLAHRMTGNAQDAEDVVQEALLKAYRNIDRFEERSNLSSWLHRIAANCAYDLLRTRSRREPSFDALATEDGEAPAQRIPADDPPPDRLVFSGEVRRRVKVAMARMSAVERSAFTLRHLQGMSIEEIGRALDLDEGAAKHSVFRAVRKLRQALAPMGTTA
jgi:RNA polymerase sigma-70 factor (ECF subfamily)